MNHNHPRLYFILFLGSAIFAALLIAWQWNSVAFAIDASLLTGSTLDRSDAIPNRQKLPRQTVKALYLTASSAGNRKKMDEIIALLNETELNSVVIDIKDYSGAVLFDSRVPLANELKTERVRIQDIRGLIDRLHEEGIYAIARQTVFQDPLLAERKKEWAFQKKTGGLWRDKKGLAWVNPGSEAVWRYNMDIAKDAIRTGFDEINFDYVRFPSDGNMTQVAYTNGDEPLHSVMRRFYEFVAKELDGWPVWISLDMFGLVMERHDGMSIGQRLEDAVGSADFISPMMYPSHYAKGHLGFENPAEYPADVIDNGMKKGLPYFKGKRAMVRPWIQAFNLGAVYDGVQIRAEIDAVERYSDAGWMLWNASNRYSEEGLKREQESV